jgi:hypothetical protein
MSTPMADGPPSKKARPNESVMPGKAAAGSGGQPAAAGAKSGRGMLTLEEVCTSRLLRLFSAQ